MDKCKDNPRTTWVVLACCKIYSVLQQIRTAGQPVGEEGSIIWEFLSAKALTPFFLLS